MILAATSGDQYNSDCSTILDTRFISTKPVAFIVTSVAISQDDGMATIVLKSVSKRCNMMPFETTLLKLFKKLLDKFLHPFRFCVQMNLNLLILDCPKVVNNFRSPLRVQLQEHLY